MRLLEHSGIAILYSGGIDCGVVAAFVDRSVPFSFVLNLQSRLLPTCVSEFPDVWWFVSAFELVSFSFCRILPQDYAVDLLNVSFAADDQSCDEVAFERAPDRITARESLEELR